VARQWSKTEAFEHFGIELENVRWSWSGISSDGATVALVLWQDVVKRDGPNHVYRDDEDPDAEWRQRIGSKRRTEHLKHTRDRLGGRFRAVIAKAVDVTADPRQIERCFPQEGVWWQLDTFDEITGAFTARVAGRD
jgi:hypothetical protein